MAGTAATLGLGLLSAFAAGVGFVRDACLQWFHEAKAVGDSAADGLYLAGAIGSLGAGLGMEWVRPEVGYGARYRKTTLALAFTDQKEWSLAVGEGHSSPVIAGDRDRGSETRLVAAQQTHQLEPVHSRQLHVHDHQVRLHLGDALQQLTLEGSLAARNHRGGTEWLAQPHPRGHRVGVVVTVTEDLHVDRTKPVHATVRPAARDHCPADGDSPSRGC